MTGELTLMGKAGSCRLMRSLDPGTREHCEHADPVNLAKHCMTQRCDLRAAKLQSQVLKVGGIKEKAGHHCFLALR